MGGATLAASEHDVTKHPAATVAYSIAPAEMSPGSSEYKYDVDTSLTLNRQSSTSDYACFTAGVHLPQGAKIKQLIVSYSSDIYADPLVILNRVDLVENGDSLVHSQIADNDNTLRVVAYTVPRKISSVDNMRYHYRFRLCVGYGDVFFGARVVYVPPG